MKKRNNEIHLRSLRGGGEIADIEPRNSRGEFLRNFRGRKGFPNSTIPSFSPPPWNRSPLSFARLPPLPLALICNADADPIYICMRFRTHIPPSTLVRSFSSPARTRFDFFNTANFNTPPPPSLFCFLLPSFSPPLSCEFIENNKSIRRSVSGKNIFFSFSETMERCAKDDEIFGVWNQAG